MVDVAQAARFIVPTRMTSIGAPLSEQQLDFISEVAAARMGLAPGEVVARMDKEFGPATFAVSVELALDFDRIPNSGQFLGDLPRAEAAQAVRDLLDRSLNTEAFHAEMVAEFGEDQALTGWVDFNGGYRFTDGIEIDGETDIMERLSSEPIETIDVIDGELADAFGWDRVREDEVIICFASYEVYATYDPEGNGPANLLLDGVALTAESTDLLRGSTLHYDGRSNEFGVVHVDGSTSRLAAYSDFSQGDCCWWITDLGTGMSYSPS